MKSLSEAARRLVQNLEHSGRQLKGTMEVRRLMRYETNAGRIRRGTPIFLTFSPDEKHNVLMLRLHRSRQRDPINSLDWQNAKFGQRDLPKQDEDYVQLGVSVQDVLDELPEYDERRSGIIMNSSAILANLKDKSPLNGF